MPSLQPTHQRVFDPYWVAAQWQTFVQTTSGRHFRILRGTEIVPSCQKAIAKLAAYLTSRQMPPAAYFSALKSRASRQANLKTRFKLPFTNQLGSPYVNRLVDDEHALWAAQFAGDQAKAFAIRVKIPKQSLSGDRPRRKDIEDGVTWYVETRRVYSSFPDERFWFLFTKQIHPAFLRYFRPFWQADMDCYLTDTQVEVICNLGADQELNHTVFQWVSDAWVRTGGHVRELFFV